MKRINLHPFPWLKMLAWGLKEYNKLQATIWLHCCVLFYNLLYYNSCTTPKHDLEHDLPISRWIAWSNFRLNSALFSVVRSGNLWNIIFISFPSIVSLLYPFPWQRGTQQLCGISNYYLAPFKMAVLGFSLVGVVLDCVYTKVVFCTHPNSGGVINSCGQLHSTRWLSMHFSCG